MLKTVCSLHLNKIIIYFSNKNKNDKLTRFATLARSLLNVARDTWFWNTLRWRLCITTSLARPNALEHYAWQMKLEPSSFHHITWWTTRLLLLLRRFNQPSLGNAVVVHVVGGNSLWQMAKSLEFFLWLHASAASQIYTQIEKKCDFPARRHDVKVNLFTQHLMDDVPRIRGQFAKSIPFV